MIGHKTHRKKYAQVRYEHTTAREREVKDCAPVNMHRGAEVGG